MAVMNDMLRSPPLSAHIFAQNHADAALKPMHGRPRSRTAPSTPLVEAPAAPFVAPIELPGSFPLEKLEKKPLLSLHHHSVDGKVRGNVFTQYPVDSPLGASIIRPHSSPQEATHRIPDGSNASTPMFSPRSNLQTPAQPSPRRKSAGPHGDVGTSLSNNSREDTLVSKGNDSFNLIKRPTFPALPDEPLTSSSLPSSVMTSRVGSSNAVPQLNSWQHHNTTWEQLQQVDSEAILIEQISDLRASHEAHVNSLKEAHEKEVASQRSYISFLERRRARPLLPTTESKQSLTIDTSHSSVQSGELLNSDASATTLHSFESSLGNQKRASQDAASGVEALKRKLSLCRKAQVDAVEVRRERDQLRDAAERSERRILQLKDIIRKAKDNEKALRNAAGDLEARLVAANNERTDVLEGYHEACERIRFLSEQEAVLRQELESSRNGQSCRQPSPDTEKAGEWVETVKYIRPVHGRSRSDVDMTSMRRDALSRQVQDLRRHVANKDAHIRRLEEVLSAGPVEEKSSQNTSALARSTRISELEESLEKHKQLLADAQANSERYNSLLHHELRRQTRSSLDKAHTVTPKIEAEASVMVTEKISQLKAQSDTHASTSFESATPGESQQEPLAVVLEKELEHCIKEIIHNK